MTNEKQRSCAELVNESLEHTMETIRLMLRPTIADMQVNHDGKSIFLGESEVDIILEDEPSVDTWKEEFGALVGLQRDMFYEYGLSFDYVQTETNGIQDEGYFRYQLSWGGPSTEFRFYVNPDMSMHKCEYWYLDWFDGAKADVPNEFAQMLWSEFEETEAAQAALDEVLNNNVY